MTYGEIKACIRAYNRRVKERNDTKKNDTDYAVTVAYRTAITAGKTVLAGFSKTLKVPSLKEAFPELYPDTVDRQEPWQNQKARFAAYAAAYNDSLKRKRRKTKEG